MRRALLVLVAAALLLAGAFLYLAPASLLATRVERATGGAVEARQVEGTVWRGRGVLAAADAQLPIAWTVDPEALLQGVLQVHVGPYEGVATVPRADVLAQRDQVSLRDVDLTMPLPLVAEALGGRAARQLGIVADGDLAIRSRRLDWVPPALTGDLNLVWRAARLSLPTYEPIELGDVSARLSANGERLSGPVGNSGGVMDIRGEIGVRADRSAEVTLLLTPRKADDAMLRRALGTIGKPEGGGWRVSWRTGTR